MLELLEEEAERKRDRYQEMFATMTLDERRSRRPPGASSRHWRESLESLERDKDWLLEHYATLAPEAL